MDRCTLFIRIHFIDWLHFLLIHTVVFVTTNRDGSTSSGSNITTCAWGWKRPKARDTHEKLILYLKLQDLKVISTKEYNIPRHIPPHLAINVKLALNKYHKKKIQQMIDCFVDCFLNHLNYGLNLEIC